MLSVHFQKARAELMLTDLSLRSYCILQDNGKMAYLEFPWGDDKQQSNDLVFGAIY